MSARIAYYFMLGVGCFVTGMGHYISGPALIVLAAIYRERIVSKEGQP